MPVLVVDNDGVGGGVGGYGVIQGFHVEDEHRLKSHDSSACVLHPNHVRWVGF